MQIQVIGELIYLRSENCTSEIVNKKYIYTIESKNKGTEIRIVLCYPGMCNTTIDCNISIEDFWNALK